MFQMGYPIAQLDTLAIVLQFSDNSSDAVIASDVSRPRCKAQKMNR